MVCADDNDRDRRHYSRMGTLCLVGPEALAKTAIVADRLDRDFGCFAGARFGNNSALFHPAK